jgi:hypothetical protein
MAQISAKSGQSENRKKGNNRKIESMGGKAANSFWIGEQVVSSGVTDLHANFVVRVSLLADAVGDGIDDVDLEEIGRGGVGIVQRLLLHVQPPRRVRRRLGRHLLASVYSRTRLCSTNYTPFGPRDPPMSVSPVGRPRISQKHSKVSKLIAD